jgi:hypothetical protein
MADLLLIQLADRRLEWGRGSLGTPSELRARYIGALQSADRGDDRPLLQFLQIDWRATSRNRVNQDAAVRELHNKETETSTGTMPMFGNFHREAAVS